MSVFFATVDDVEEAFYAAVSRSDLDALMAVWAEDEDIVCIHPTGYRLSGAQAIRESWRSIFESTPHLSMRVVQSMRWTGMLLSVHSVVETLYVGSETAPHGPLLTTSIYQRGAKGWRLLSRHSSAAAEGDAFHESSDSVVRTLH